MKHSLYYLYLFIIDFWDSFVFDHLVCALGGEEPAFASGFALGRGPVSVTLVTPPPPPIGCAFY